MGTTTTERIALEVRGQARGLSEFERVEKSLISLLRLQSAFNRQTLRLSVANPRDIDRYEARLQSLGAALKSLGDTQLGTRIGTDVNRLGDVVDHSRAKLQSLSEQLAKLKQAQAARPAANLGGRETQLTAQIEAYRAVMEQAALMQRELGLGAARLAGQEDRLTGSSKKSGQALKGQTDTLSLKQKQLEATKKAVDRLTDSEETNAKAAAKTNQENQEIRRVVKDDQLAARTLSTGVGQQRTITYGKEEGSQTVTDVTDFQEQYRRERKTILQRSRDAIKQEQDLGRQSARLKETVSEIENLQGKLSTNNLQDSDLFFQLGEDARAATNEAERLARAADRVREATTRKDNLATIDRDRKRIVGQLESETRASRGNQTGIAEANERAATGLRDLQSRMRGLGLAGEEAYGAIGIAAAKAEAQAHGLRNVIADTEKKLSQRKVRSGFAESQKDIAATSKATRTAAVGDQRQQAQAYRDEAARLRGVQFEMATLGEIGTEQYRAIGRAAEQADAAARKVEATLARTERKARESRLASAIGTRRDAIDTRFKAGKIESRDTAGLLGATQGALGELEALEKQLVRMGATGTREYRDVQESIVLTRASVNSLTADLQKQQTALAQGRARGQAALDRVQSAIAQDYVKKSDETTTNRQGGLRRTIVLERDDQNERRMIRAVVDLDSALQPLNATLTETEKNLATTGSRTSWLNRNFIDNTKTVVAWAASVYAYQAALQTIHYTTAAVIDLQRKSAVLTAVYQHERQEAVRLKGETLALAAAQGRSGSEALDAATRFARLGLTRVQILEATAVALKAANVAEIEAGVAAEQLSAIMAAYRLEASQLYTVLTRLNNVSNQFNTTNKDLLEGVARVGNLARETGLDLETLIAIVGTGTGLTGRSGAEFGNAIKSIIVSLSTPSIQKDLKGLFNFDTRDASGQIQQMDDLIRGLAVSYQKLTGSERQELLQLVGKKQQASRLAVILGDYTTIQRNLTAALKDGTATEAENADIRATLISQLTSLRSAYESLAVSSTAAFEEGGAGAIANVTIRSLTILIDLLEKVSGVFPIAAGAAGLFFYRFIKGAAAIEATTIKGGFLVNTVRRLDKVWEDLSYIMTESQKRQAAAGNQTGILSRAMARLKQIGAGAAGVFTNLGKVIRFTIGSLTSLAGNIAATYAVFKVIEYGTQVYEEHQQAAEAARRASLGFSEDLQQIADAARRAGVVKDTADFIAQVADAADQASLTRFVADLAKIANLSPRDAEFLNGLAESGRAADVQREALRLRAKAAEEEIRLSDEAAAEAAKNIQAGRALVEKLRRDLEDLQATGQTRGQSALKEEIEQELSKLNDFESKYNEAMERIRGNTQVLLEIRVDQESLDASRELIGKQAQDLAGLIAGDNALGKVLEQSLKHTLTGAGLRGLLDETAAGFDRQLGDLRDRLARQPSQADTSEFQANLRRRQAEAGRAQEAFRQAQAELVAFQAGGAAPDRFLSYGQQEYRPSRAVIEDLLQREANAAAAARDAANKELDTFRAQNPALEQAVTGRRELTAAIDEVTKAREASLNVIKRQQIEEQREAEIFEGQKKRLIDYALRVQQVNRIRSDAAARGNAFDTGRDEAERIQNRLSGLTGQLNRSLEGQSFYRQQIGLADRANNPTLANQLRLRLQEEEIRSQTYAAQIETERNSLSARRYTIEAEIVEAKRRQNEETSKALGLASREDQLRAAFLARFQSQNGGRRISENEFQFLDQGTREAVNKFTPGLAPISQGSDLDRLYRERDRLSAELDARLSRAEALIDRATTTAIENSAAYAGGNAALLGAGTAAAAAAANPPLPAAATQPVNITIAPGAIDINVADAFATLTSELTATVLNVTGAEMDRIRADLANINATLRRAGARGAG